MALKTCFKKRTGDCVEVSFNINRDKCDSVEVIFSPASVLHGVTLVQFKFKVHKNDNSILLSIKFEKLNTDDDFAYTLSLTSSEIEELKKKNLICEPKRSDNWHILGYCSYYDKCDIKITSTVESKQLITPSLFECLGAEDFELCGEDGFVLMHRLIMSAFSPVLRTMLAGEWQESKEGKVQMPEIKKSTLELLKSYMYSKGIPSADIEELQSLLQLAKYLMIQDLEKLCSITILSLVNADNVYFLSIFAAKHDFKILYLGILEYMYNGYFSVDSMNMTDPTTKKVDGESSIQ